LSRLLVAVAHPDDETIGAGILLSRLPFLSRVLHITDGAPRERRFLPARFAGGHAEYAAERRRELVAAMTIAGVEEASLDCLNFPDLEATCELSSLSRKVADRFEELRPDLVVTHAYEGGHPDHDATAFAVHAAAELLRRGGRPSPAILEMALYRASPGATGPNDRLMQEFLPAGPEPAATPWVLELTPSDRELKDRMLACFKTQRALLRKLSLARRESFRLAPRYDFTRPPHVGPLLYELSRFPITGERWRELARDAMYVLGLTAAQP
jgi:LmbE family N-acetylglucosaminyl deacetylase